MTLIQDRRPQRRSGAGKRSTGTLRSVLRALRRVHDEQMRMWEAFYRVSTPDTSPEAHLGSLVLPGPTRIQAQRPTAAEPARPDS